MAKNQMPMSGNMQPKGNMMPEGKHMMPGMPLHMTAHKPPTNKPRKGIKAK